jgi:microcystin-dependent protein
MEGYIAEIRMFAGNFAPRNWAFCSNQLLSIAQNTALFSLLGTTYGGNGQTTFALPDFRGRTPVGTGQGPGLSNIQLGELSGAATVTLLTTNLPAHNHPITGAITPQVNNDNSGLTSDASGNRLASSGNLFTAASADLVSMAPAASTLAVGNTGGNLPFNNMPPYAGMNYIICLFGIYPSRN